MRYVHLGQLQRTGNGKRLFDNRGSYRQNHCIAYFFVITMQLQDQALQ